MRSESTGDKFDRELWAAELNPLLALWKKLNQVSIKFCLHIIFRLYTVLLIFFLLVA